MFFDIVLGIAQAILGLFFLFAGLPKILGRGLSRWIGFDAVPRGLTIAIGTAEVAAGAALLIAPVTGLLLWSVPLAALGIAAISLAASGFHLREREWLPALETAMWAALGTTVAVARWSLLGAAPLATGVVPGVLACILLPALAVNLTLLLRAPAGTMPEPAPAAP
ncbi:DoxX family protein [Microbacterium sp. NPDC058389]|uniref:DoxX family protein n=1 Tax=Microbacterium sp. NPDC058389 TaxID=3346475 RepID=UPI00365BA046